MKLLHARVQCKEETNQQAKYGNPEWHGWMKELFGYYKLGDDAVKTGLIRLDKDVELENMFGAMERVQVICTYDLATEHVINVSVLPE